MKCLSCGAEIPDSASFCGVCGAKVNRGKCCAKCGAPLAENATFCDQCGTVRYDSSFGDCHYFVQDYTNNGTLESKALSNSQAKVIVYKGNDLLGVYTVPTDMGRVYWNVFSIVNGEIIVENTLSYDKPYDIWAANDDYYY